MPVPTVDNDREVVESRAATDEELVLRLQRGDDSAFAQLVQRYETEIYWYLKRYLGDAVLAEDVFQNTFLQVHQKSDLYDRQRRFRPWLYAIATHQAIDALRRQKRFTRLSLEGTTTIASDGESATLADLLVSRGTSPEGAADLSETRQRVRAAVDELPDHLKPVVVMAYFQGLKYKDIADAMVIPVGTVKSRLFAAMRQLQVIWCNSTHSDGHQNHET